MTTRAPPGPNIRLADRLLAERKIAPEQYEAAVTHLKRVGGRIEESLLEVNAIPEVELLKFIAAQHRTRYVSTERLAKADIDRMTIEKIPKKLAERWTVVPVMYDPAAGSISIVTADPDNLEMLDDVRLAAGVRDVHAFVARPLAVKAAVNKLYHGDIHAFAILDRKAQEEFASLLNVYERNLLGEESMSVALADAHGRERTMSERDIERAGATAGGSVTTHAATDQYLETLNVLVSLIEASRPDLRGHSSHVARLARKLVERIGLVKVEQDAIVLGAYLHDLGKMGTYHLTALNVAQYEGHRTAAEKAYQMPRRLTETVVLSPTTVGALESMYERYDGKGLPGERAGKDIPLGARVLAIADTYADLTQNPRNPYRKALRPSEACGVLKQFKDGVFDPNLVDLFCNVVSGDDLRARILASRHLVLLADADPEETTVLELRLLEQGFEVRVARTSDQAYRMLEGGEFELVVSELEMKPADGLALLADARGRDWGRDLPWLFLTRKQGRAETQRAFELGVIDYVIKPAASDVLVAKLRQALERRKGKEPRGVSGSLREMGLPDLVQVLWHGRKSGSLKIKSGAESGEIHLVDGRVVNAMWGRQRGEEAFYAMLDIEDGEFRLDPEFRAPAQVINASPEALLLEGMRRLDEEGRRR